MRRVPIEEQIAAVQLAVDERMASLKYRLAKAKIEEGPVKEEELRLNQALATLRFVEKHQATIKALVEAPRDQRQMDFADVADSSRRSPEGEGG